MIASKTRSRIDAPGSKKWRAKRIGQTPWFSMLTVIHLTLSFARTTSLLIHLKALPGVADLSINEKRLTQLLATATATNPSAAAKREQLFMEASALQRQIAFSNPLLRFTKILFIKDSLQFRPGSNGNIINCITGCQIHVASAHVGSGLYHLLTVQNSIAS
ncbi:MAG TPA: hypothetical protein VGP72_20515 [Planctomycetota bacterium]